MDYLSIILIIPSESSSAKIFLVESSSSLPRGQWFWWFGLCYYTAGQKLSLFLHQFLNLSQVSNGFWSSRAPVQIERLSFGHFPDQIWMKQSVYLFQEQILISCPLQSHYLNIICRIVDYNLFLISQTIII